VAQRSLLVLLERMAPYLAQHLSTAANAQSNAAELLRPAPAGVAHFAAPDMAHEAGDSGDEDEDAPAGQPSSSPAASLAVPNKQVEDTK
jgi:hypothetical protein